MRAILESQSLAGTGLQELMREMLVRLGEDPERDGLRDTPERMERSMQYLTKGYQENPEEGMIIASGSNSVPAPYRNEAKVSLELWLRDEQGNETNHKFTGRVDRSIKRKHQRQQQDRRIAAPQLMREGLYVPAQASIGGKTSFGDAITGADSEISSAEE